MRPHYDMIIRHGLICWRITRCVNILSRNSVGLCSAGTRRSLDLTAQKKQIEAFQSTIHTAQSNMKVMDQSLTAVTQIATDFRAEFIQDRVFLGSTRWKPSRPCC